MIPHVACALWGLASLAQHVHEVPLHYSDLLLSSCLFNVINFILKVVFLEVQH